MGCLNGRYPVIEVLWVSNDFFCNNTYGILTLSCKHCVLYIELLKRFIP